MKKVTCKICKKEFYARLRAIRVGHGQYCSRICRNKGRVYTIKTRLKMSRSHKGNVPTIETRKKMSESRRGWTPSKKTRENMSNAQKGVKSAMFGKHLNVKIRKKLSEALRGKHTIDYFRKLAILSNIKQQIMKGPTSIEKRVYEQLKKQGLLFKDQYLINEKFLVDAYIPSINLIIEVDGNYWHSLPKVKIKDMSENAYLLKCGYGLLRLTEKEIRDDSFIEKLRGISNA